jgi:hypothetical protein
VAGDAVNGVPAWNPALTEDRPTPSHSPMPRGSGEAADNDRRIQANAITPSIFGKVDQPSRGDIEVFTGDERKMAGNVSLSSTRGGSTTPETRAETWIDTYKHHGSRAFFKRIAAAWNDTASADLDWRKSN